jgi:DNA-binding CsgD family transcriptional regulator
MCGVRGAEAEAPLRRAVEILEALPPTRELGMAYAYTVMFDMNHGSIEAGTEMARKAVEVAERFDDTDTLIHTLNSLGCFELLAGDPAGRKKLLRSLDLADELGLDEAVGRAYLNLANVLAETHQHDGLLEIIKNGKDYSSQHGLELWRMWLLTSEARVHLDRCDWSQAAEVADMVLRGERGQLPRIDALPVLALVRARRGDPDVWALLDEARIMAERQGGSVLVALARAEAAWLEGRNDIAIEETAKSFKSNVDLDAWWYLGDLAVWRRRAGARDDVHPKLPERYRAELSGDHATAGSDDEELLRQSLTKLQRLGARPAAAIVARKLRALGVSGVTRGPRPATQRNPAQLTEREVEVLELLSAGMRNADIAKKLFLAPKTVDHHVSAILRKLDVESRTEAIRAASRIGLLT